MIQDFDPRQTMAFMAILETGSFEAAAQKLNITPAAVSQRMRALENALGAPLVQRVRPCVATRQGMKLAHFVRKRELLLKDFQREFVPSENQFLELSISLNNDSIGSWFMPAISAFIIKNRILLNIQLIDQDLTHRHMEEGRVVAALSSNQQAMRGCSSRFLGNLRYFMMASQDFMQRWFSSGFCREAAKRAPTLVFDRHDLLQEKFLQKYLGMSQNECYCHHIPASEPFTDAIRLGLGYGMVPHTMLKQADQSELLNVLPNAYIDVPLYWHQWDQESWILSALGKEVVAKAESLLIQ
ncbi:MAG: LysR family transcriptional regulator ArgP [Advenella sp.]